MFLTEEGNEFLEENPVELLPLGSLYLPHLIRIQATGKHTFQRPNVRLNIFLSFHLYCLHILS